MDSGGRIHLRGKGGAISPDFGVESERMCVRDPEWINSGREALRLVT